MLLTIHLMPLIGYLVNSSQKQMNRCPVCRWIRHRSIAGLPDFAGFVTRADESLGRIGHFIKIVITPKESLGRMRILIDWILE